MKGFKSNNLQMLWESAIPARNTSLDFVINKDSGNSRIKQFQLTRNNEDSLPTLAHADRNASTKTQKSYS